MVMITDQLLDLYVNASDAIGFGSDPRCSMAFEEEFVSVLHAEVKAHELPRGGGPRNPSPCPLHPGISAQRGGTGRTRAADEGDGMDLPPDLLLATAEEAADLSLATAEDAEEFLRARLDTQNVDVAMMQDTCLLIAHAFLFGRVGPRVPRDSLAHPSS